MRLREGGLAVVRPGIPLDDSRTDDPLPDRCDFCGRGLGAHHRPVRRIKLPGGMSLRACRPPCSDAASFLEAHVKKEDVQRPAPPVPPGLFVDVPRSDGSLTPGGRLIGPFRWETGTGWVAQVNFENPGDGCPMAKLVCIPELVDANPCLLRSVTEPHLRLFLASAAHDVPDVPSPRRMTNDLS